MLFVDDDKFSMIKFKKIKTEYLILIIAWLFWGFSHALIWVNSSGKPNYAWILSTTTVQTLNCIVFNLLALQIMLFTQRKVKQINKRYLIFAVIVVLVSLALVFTNVTSYNLIRGFWKDNVKLFNSLSLYLVNTTEKIIYITGYSTMFFLIRNLKEVQKQKDIAEEAQQQARDAQLQLLQQQLSPHFLFNTLNSLRSLIASDSNRAREMVTDLSDFLRVTLSSYKSLHNSIADEISMVEYYLKIQKVRFDNDLHYKISIDRELAAFLIPKFVIQPLVENAVKFGMQTSAMPLEISISAQRKDGGVVIEVSNSGSLVAEKQEAHSSQGLNNTSKRLELMYPGKSHFQLTEKQGLVICTISIDEA